MCSDEKKLGNIPICVKKTVTKKRYDKINIKTKPIAFKLVLDSVPKNVGGHSIDDIKQLDEIEIEFSHNRKHEYDEFMKQLKGQEDGLNGLTIQDYFNKKALFDELGRDTSINAIIKEIRGK